MVATLKFSKVQTSPLLKTVKSQSKLLELIVLDDSDIEIIEDGGSIGDVNLDSIETMSVRELKKALRDAKADIDAKEQVIKTKDQKANELLAENAKLKSPAQIKERAESEAQQIELAALDTLRVASNSFLIAFNTYINAIGGVLDTASEKDLPKLDEPVNESLVATCQRFAQYIHSMGVEIDFEEMVRPAWMYPDADDLTPINIEDCQ